VDASTRARILARAGFTDRELAALLNVEETDVQRNQLDVTYQPPAPSGGGSGESGGGGEPVTVHYRVVVSETDFLPPDDFGDDGDSCICDINIEGYPRSLYVFSKLDGGWLNRSPVVLLDSTALSQSINPIYTQLDALSAAVAAVGNDGPAGPALSVQGPWSQGLSISAGQVWQYEKFSWLVVATDNDPPAPDPAAPTSSVDTPWVKLGVVDMAGLATQAAVDQAVTEMQDGRFQGEWTGDRDYPLHSIVNFGDRSFYRYRDTNLAGRGDPFVDDANQEWRRFADLTPARQQWSFGGYVQGAADFDESPHTANGLPDGARDGNAHRVYSVQTPAAARVRIYPTSEARAADVARAAGVDPAVPCFLDVVTGGAETVLLAPPAEMYVATPGDTYFIRVDNLSGADGSAGATLTYVTTER
jgi:hypothetical protein